jgi:hypothetical protein
MLAAAFSTGKMLRLLGFFGLIPALLWFYLYFMNTESASKEKQKNDIRPVHSILWGFFAYLAIHQNESAWIVLLVDLLFGLTMYIMHHRQRDAISK